MVKRIAALAALIVAAALALVQVDPSAAHAAAPSQMPWRQISTGGQHSCGIRTDGSLWCWGNNIDLELGLGDAVHRQIPTHVDPDTTWISVAVGIRHTCGVQTGGTLWCWGWNDFGQLASADYVPGAASPQRAIPATTGWASVTAGAFHTCALKTTGTLWCWGRGDEGQLGLGSTTDRRVATQVGAATYTGVAAGTAHTCAVRTDTTLWCWGRGDYGQLGRGSTTDLLSPAPVGDVFTDFYRLVTAGAEHTCATRTDDSLWCWGRNQFGGLGIGGTVNQTRPTRVGTAAWSMIDAGEGYTCGTQTTGRLWCWGRNNIGQLGQGDTIDRDAPRVTTTLAAWTGLSAGQAHTCAVRAAALWCWGRNGRFELGQNDTTIRLAPAQVTRATVWEWVFSGDNHTCAVKSDTTLWCWGLNSTGQLGNGNLVDQSRPHRVIASGADTWFNIVPGGTHTCAMKPTADIYCWGSNGNGQLGQGPIGAVQVAPQQLIGHGASTLATGARHTCATGAGRLKCWGANASFQLGLGESAGTEDQPVPVQLADGPSDWRLVFAGTLHTCAVQDAGILWCWGDNSLGQLGVGDTAIRQTPAQVLSSDGVDNDWASVAARYHSCAIRTAVRSLWCWGDNDSGQLGIGSTAVRRSPARAGTATNWIQVATGHDHTCGRRSPGSLWCWGSNTHGQLGDGTITQRPAITRIGTLSDWVSVAAGRDHTCGVRGDGTLWCWGLNSSGQLGLGHIIRQLSPTLVG